jgi:hypothetical protein
MKLLLALALVCAATTATTACGPRKVEVQTGPTPVSEVSLSVTNNLSQAVNVYVVTGSNDIFLKQVPGKSTLQMNVPGVAAGTTVKLRATPVNGTQSYTRDNVTLSGLYEWTVP